MDFIPNLSQHSIRLLCFDIERKFFNANDQSRISLNYTPPKAESIIDCLIIILQAFDSAPSEDSFRMMS